MCGKGTQSLSPPQHAVTPERDEYSDSATLTAVGTSTSPFYRWYLVLMNAWLRRLFEPASTSPTDAFAWNDKRSKSKQVANGFRIAGGLIAGFVVIGVAFVRVAGLSEEHPTQSGVSVLASWTALVVAALIMLWTANRWAPFVTGFFFGPAVLRILGSLPSGMTHTIHLIR
jgi:hypothetical protein